MTNARFMVTGKRLDNGEAVTGFYLRIPASGNIPDRHEIIGCDENISPYAFYNVDPASVEPVAVKPIKKILDSPAATYAYVSFKCPNCIGGVIESEKKYCSNCGQRLDWTERKDGAEQWND